MELGALSIHGYAAVGHTTLQQSRVTLKQSRVTLKQSHVTNSCVHEQFSLTQCITRFCCSLSLIPIFSLG